MYNARDTAYSSLRYTDKLGMKEFDMPDYKMNIKVYRRIDLASIWAFCRYFDIGSVIFDELDDSLLFVDAVLLLKRNFIAYRENYLNKLWC